MPNTDKDRSYLEGEREAVLSELRSKEPELVDRFLKLSAAIVSYDAIAAEIAAKGSQVDPAAEEFIKIHNPLDAVEALLTKIDKPIPVEDLGRAIEDGGWAKGRLDYPRWNIIYAVRNHLKPKLMQRKKVKVLKEVNGLVGKIEWPDEMFSAAQENGLTPKD